MFIHSVSKELVIMVTFSFRALIKVTEACTYKIADQFQFLFVYLIIKQTNKQTNNILYHSLNSLLLMVLFACLWIKWADKKLLDHSENGLLPLAPRALVGAFRLISTPENCVCLNKICCLPDLYVGCCIAWEVSCDSPDKGS